LTIIIHLFTLAARVAQNKLQAAVFQLCATFGLSAKNVFIPELCTTGDFFTGFVLVKGAIGL
jgi:hypothetical protein